MERLTRLAEDNERSNDTVRKALESAAADREEMRDALRAVGTQDAALVDALRDVAKNADAAAATTLANQKILTALLDAGALQSIKVNIARARRKRRGK